MYVGGRVPHQRGPAGGGHPRAPGAGGAARGPSRSLAAQPARQPRELTARAARPGAARPHAARPRAARPRLLRPRRLHAVPRRHSLLAHRRPRPARRPRAVHPVIVRSAGPSAGRLAEVAVTCRVRVVKCEAIELGSMCEDSSVGRAAAWATVVLINISNILIDLALDYFIFQILNGPLLH